MSRTVTLTQDRGKTKDKLYLTKLNTKTPQKPENPSWVKDQTKYQIKQHQQSATKKKYKTEEKKKPKVKIINIPHG